MSNRISLVVLVSGSGTTLQNLIDEISARRLAADIKLVIGSREGLLGIERAERASLATKLIERKLFRDTNQFSREIFDEVDRVQPELVCLAGWLCLLEIPERYRGRVLNIHPALLPRFGGKGMYGRRVQDAVIASGARESGCTVHWVNDEYDSGEIVLQRRCAVKVGDTAETLAQRVFEEEKIAYPDAIRLVADQFKKPRMK